MSITLRDGTIHLEGRCGVEEAEILLGHLSTAEVRVDLGRCEHLHAALAQLLMAAPVSIVGEPGGFLGTWVLPFLSAQPDPDGKTG